MYSKRFGAEKFEIITDSKPIQELKLDPNRVYLQLTSVEPYFEGPGEPPSGDFEESHGLTKFVYETPFTKEGKARTDDVTKQWMTKNISVTVASFPYCKKRIEVDREDSIQISPLQIAISSLKKKNRELNDVISNEPLDLKKLQLRLQGSVMVTVNSGSLTYARAFIGNTDIPEADQDDLKAEYVKFISLCQKALEINVENSTDPSSFTYHKTLRDGCMDIKQQLSDLGVQFD